MKHWKFIPIIAIVLFSSCRKSLTIDPANHTVPEGYFTSAQKVQQAVVGGYVDLRRALLANYAWLMYGEARVGDLKLNVPFQYLVANQQLKADNRYVQQLTDWSYLYDVIKDANDVLMILNSEDAASLSNDERNLFRGEALALKSMAYFYLARVWGNVVSAEANNFGTKLTSQQAVSQAVNWAAEAQRLLPWLLINDDGIESTALTAVRFSKTSVTLMLAQQELWLGNAQNAYDVLTTTFATTPSDSLSGFGLAVGADRRTELPGGPLLDANVVNMPIASFNAIYPSGDGRRNLFNISNTAATLKANEASKLDLLTLTDLKLTQAEAAWKAGFIDEAKDLLVDAAAGATEDYTALTEETFGDALLLERQRLLVGTGQRMFDLIRFGQVSAYIPAFSETDVENGAAFWPFSANSIKGNQLTQNSFWSNP